jgi:predicted transcriptional regulator
MKIKQTLDDAGISAAEFATLCGVTKNMVYKWIKGAKPHVLRESKVNKILVAISLAVDEGDLPLAGIDNTRPKRIQSVVIANIKKTV